MLRILKSDELGNIISNLLFKIAKAKKNEIINADYNTIKPKIEGYLQKLESFIDDYGVKY